MYNKNLITEYERILKDPTKVAIDTYHFKNLSPDAQQNTAVSIIKYAIQYIMHYTPQEAVKYMNPTVFKYLKLTSLFKYIKIPTGLEEKDQIVYIMSLCFPKVISFDPKYNIQLIYEKVIESKTSKKNNIKKFTYPKGFFGNFDAQFNAAICLQFMIMRYLHVKDINTLYKIFSDKKKAISILTEHYLQKPAKKLYNDNTLEYLHESLCPQERSDFLYFNFLYINFLEKECPDIKLKDKEECL